MELNQLNVLVRKGIVFKLFDPLGYRYVQGCHAVAQWLLDNKVQSWNNNYLNICETKGDTDDFDFMLMKLKDQKIPYSEFREPDLNNTLTAIAVHNNDKFFKNCKKLGV
jgi:hypothetical protein